MTFGGVVQMDRQEGVARGPAQSSRKTLGSHAKYFGWFAKEVGGDEGVLGEPYAVQELPAVQGREEETATTIIVVRDHLVLGRRPRGRSETTIRENMH